MDDNKADDLKNAIIRCVWFPCHHLPNLSGNKIHIGKNIIKIPLIKGFTSIYNHVAKRLKRCYFCTFVHLTRWFYTYENLFCKSKLGIHLQNTVRYALSVYCLIPYLFFFTTVIISVCWYYGYPAISMEVFLMFWAYVSVYVTICCPGWNIRWKQRTVFYILQCLI